ncbi:MAG: hypothetical protein ACK4TA_22335 [Saprospiraceae bacterium]
MRTIKIEVQNERQLELLQMLASMTGMRVVDDAPSEEDLARARAIIDAGVPEMTESRLNEMLEWLEEGRADRELPFEAR